MEPGWEQIFVLAVILLAAAFDLLVRWLKRKAGDQPADVATGEDDADLLEHGRVKPPLPPSVSTLPPLPASRPSQPPPAVRMPRRRRHARHWLQHPADARRGIVLMAVLGPCRGLEGPHGDA